MKKQNKVRSTDGLVFIDSLDEIPAFATEHEEWEWWETHTFSEALLNSLPVERRPLGPIKRTARRDRIQLTSWDEVPDFTSEEEERSWWDDHEPTWELLQTLPKRKIMPTRLESLRGFVQLGRSKGTARRKVS